METSSHMFGATSTGLNEVQFGLNEVQFGCKCWSFFYWKSWSFYYATFFGALVLVFLDIGLGADVGLP